MHHCNISKIRPRVLVASWGWAATSDTLHRIPYGARHRSRVSSHPAVSWATVSTVVSRMTMTDDSLCNPCRALWRTHWLHWGHHCCHSDPHLLSSHLDDRCHFPTPSESPCWNSPLRDVSGGGWDVSDRCRVASGVLRAVCRAQRSCFSHRLSRFSLYFQRPETWHVIECLVSIGKTFLS